MSYMVGAHWFMFHDEPISGRYDNENSNTGIVNSRDEGKLLEI